MCGLAKCDGYTYAMNLLCKQAGVESLYTEGLLLPEKSFHAWNINKVDGKWYYTDVTWDDQIGLDPIHNYRYLLLGSDKLSNRQPNYTYGLDISESRSPYRPYTNTETAVFITVLVLIVLLLVWFFVSRHIRNRKFVRMYLEKKERQQQTRTDGT